MCKKMLTVALMAGLLVAVVFVGGCKKDESPADAVKTDEVKKAADEAVDAAADKADEAAEEAKKAADKLLD